MLASGGSTGGKLRLLREPSFVRAGKSDDWSHFRRRPLALSSRLRCRPVGPHLRRRSGNSVGPPFRACTARASRHLFLDRSPQLANAGTAANRRRGGSFGFRDGMQTYPLVCSQLAHLTDTHRPSTDRSRGVSPCPARAKAFQDAAARAAIIATPASHRGLSSLTTEAARSSLDSVAPVQSCLRLPCEDVACARRIGSSSRPASDGASWERFLDQLFRIYHSRHVLLTTLPAGGESDLSAHDDVSFANRRRRAAALSFTSAAWTEIVLASRSPVELVIRRVGIQDFVPSVRLLRAAGGTACLSGSVTIAHAVAMRHRVPETLIGHRYQCFRNSTQLEVAGTPPTPGQRTSPPRRPPLVRRAGSCALAVACLRAIPSCATSGGTSPTCFAHWCRRAADAACSGVGDEESLSGERGCRSGASPGSGQS